MNMHNHVKIKNHSAVVHTGWRTVGSYLALVTAEREVERRKAKAAPALEIRIVPCSRACRNVLI